MKRQEIPASETPMPESHRKQRLLARFARMFVKIKEIERADSPVKTQGTEH
jgi:hypothetical protein